MRLAVGRQHAGITGRTNWRIEGEPAHMLCHHKSGHRLEHRHFDGLALAGPLTLQKGRHHGINHRQPDRLVADQGRHETRLAAGRCFERDEAAAALDDVVKSGTAGEWAVLAVAVCRAVDEARVDLAQALPSEAEPRHRLRTHIVHQNVALPDQRQQHRRRFLLFQIEHERAFVAVEIEKDMAHLAMPRGSGIAHDVAVRRFDLDDVGPEIGEDLRRQRPEDDRGQIENLDPRERSWFRLARFAAGTVLGLCG